MNNETTKQLIPMWLWGVLAAAAVALVLGLALTDQRREPGPSLLYDVSSYEAVDPSKILFRETARIPLDIEAPSALCARRDGTILVGGKDAILALEASGRTRSRIAIAGSPDCLAEAPDGRLYLGMRGRIAVMAALEQPMQWWPDLGQRAWITAIAVDEQNVYAADAGQRVIHRFNVSGEILGSIGARAAEEGVPGFVVPSPYFDVMLDPAGHLWAVNPGKHGVELYRPDGVLVSSWYRPSMNIEGFSGCCNPIHAAFRSDSSLVTAEKGLNRIKVYSPDTALLGVVATPEILGTLAEAAASLTEEPMVKDLAVDGEDRILALHGPRKELLIFEAIDKEEADATARSKPNR